MNEMELMSDTDDNESVMDSIRNLRIDLDAKLSFMSSAIESIDERSMKIEKFIHVLNKKMNKIIVLFQPHEIDAETEKSEIMDVEADEGKMPKSDVILPVLIDLDDNDIEDIDV